MQWRSRSSSTSGSGIFSSSSPSEPDNACGATTAGFLKALNAWFSFRRICKYKKPIAWEVITEQLELWCTRFWHPIKFMGGQFGAQVGRYPVWSGWFKRVALIGQAGPQPNIILENSNVMQQQNRVQFALLTYVNNNIMNHGSLDFSKLSCEHEGSEVKNSDSMMWEDSWGRDAAMMMEIL